MSILQYETISCLWPIKIIVLPDGKHYNKGAEQRSLVKVLIVFFKNYPVFSENFLKSQNTL